MAVPKPLEYVFRSVSEAARTSNAVGKYAKTLLPLLQEAIAQLSSTSVTRPSHRGTGDIKYRVERTEQGEVLTEHRPGRTSKPFRCPKHIYKALAEVLERTDQSLGLEELLRAMELEIGERPADHQVRVAIRLWMHVAPPLLSRNRARYRASSDIPFGSAAQNLWESLRQ